MNYKTAADAAREARLAIQAAQDARDAPRNASMAPGLVFNITLMCMVESAIECARSLVFTKAFMRAVGDAIRDGATFNERLPLD